MNVRYLWSLSVCLSVAFVFGSGSNLSAENATQSSTLNVLFIGNSYTARHNLAQVVKAMAEAGNPKLTFNATSVIYGGRRLVDHWRLGTQNIVKLHALTRSEQEATIASLELAVKDDPKDGYAKSALARHRQLLADFEAQRTKWDVIVLQSYRDDLEGSESLYAEYAPKFSELAKAQGARVILYETTPTTQNAEPLKAAPDPELMMKKAREIAALANQIDASVAPMSLVALRCQTERPDLTLRFINDAHLNQTMAYLTACSLYAALFDRSPEGLPIASITDIRFLGEDRTKDRDGDPITRAFSDKDREDLQRIAWEGVQIFQKTRSVLAKANESPKR
ncbi:MAG TPA: hypothetical protein P5307_00390 [Pirellulaceae bacterium]|nr:hypothetical protein [Planctomycetaceae bacterium]HRX77483.1 hypothetical protein [Pirellulaceae bacterium]